MCDLSHSSCVIPSLKPDSRRSNYSCSVTSAEVTLNMQNSSVPFGTVIKRIAHFLLEFQVSCINDSMQIVTFSHPALQRLRAKNVHLLYDIAFVQIKQKDLELDL